MAEETEHTRAAAAPDAANDAGPAPAPGEPPPLPHLAGMAKDLEALRDAVVDAASVGAGLWFSYLFVLLYLFIAVGSVTHRDLLLENPVKLPFLTVDLPLLGFFWLGPLIFVIVHAYVLLHFVLLAGKVGDFDAELKAQIKDEEVLTRLRHQLPSNIFVQFLAGPHDLRTGRVGTLLQLIAGSASSSAQSRCWYFSSCSSCHITMRQLPGGTGSRSWPTSYFCGCCGPRSHGVRGRGFPGANSGG
jgi:hypothetical protein